jgi:phosphoribosyl-ATP pyrophosphohydrolase
MVQLLARPDRLAGRAYVGVGLEPFREQLMRRLGEVVESLEGVIASRKRGDPDRSYTSRLLAGGVAASGAKVIEEAGELVAAAGGDSDERVVSEAADLVYHMLVLLAARDLAFAHVEDELARRFGISGLDEKASRPAKDKRP